MVARPWKHRWDLCAEGRDSGRPIVRGFSGHLLVKLEMAGCWVCDAGLVRDGAELRGSGGKLLCEVESCRGLWTVENVCSVRGGSWVLLCEFDKVKKRIEGADGTLVAVRVCRGSTAEFVDVGS